MSDQRMKLRIESGHPMMTNVEAVSGSLVRFVTEDGRTMFEVSSGEDGRSIEVRALETIADLTDECVTLRYELARAIAQRDDEGDRLDWLMANLAGNVTRGLLGELAHTGDPSEFRELIDEMRGERGQCVRRMPDNRICGLRAASCPSCAPAVHKVPQWRP